MLRDNLIATILLAAVILVVGLWITSRRTDDLRTDLQTTRVEQAVQNAQLHDARERIRVLEDDMDRIAPHKVPVSQ